MTRGFHIYTHVSTSFVVNGHSSINYNVEKLLHNPNPFKQKCHLSSRRGNVLPPVWKCRWNIKVMTYQIGSFKGNYFMIGFQLMEAFQSRCGDLFVSRTAETFMIMWEILLFVCITDDLFFMLCYAYSMNCLFRKQNKSPGLVAETQLWSQLCFFIQTWKCSWAWM